MGKNNCKNQIDSKVTYRQLMNPAGHDLSSVHITITQTRLNTKFAKTAFLAF